ncbi:hypothetical protein DCS_08092 [Drechmeria coniospora]|uniref:ERT1/acuK family PAS domain-containing protein n=1 Tax=Drechmeria coniospora TaxID=98403 RepID=A0A151GGD4_DRECN|nr:hypothetical protein DCS_08092 [Drechmeria coniospora]KYK56126.1 hypothetical protein DCS_08092 [Drechmeria coniospora]
MDTEAVAAAKLEAEGGKAVNVEASGAPDAEAEGNGARPGKSSRKRRKVNHAAPPAPLQHMTCDLERPCARCIKRNIGHLCHDEPREAETKRLKNSTKPTMVKGAGEGDAQSQAPSDATRSSVSTAMGPPPSFDAASQPASSGFDSNAVMGAGQAGQMPLVQPNELNSSASRNANQFAGFSDAWLTAQNFNDMNSYNNPNYMIAPQVTHEFNLLNDFLHSGLLDDGAAPPDGIQQSTTARTATQPDMVPSFGGREGRPAAGPGLMGHEGSMPPPPTTSDKTREYYLQAADPSGNDNAEERMARVLRAKYDAGLLKPFNYINGYARLGKYLDGHIAASSKQKILRTINQFRPKFREKAQGLTDMQLVYVEMWFEKQLMDYDRVFASMAVPACCWRRTGEIFRGNKEMAELINVPVDQLRDGQIALHEILTEESMVRYWEEFGTIAFDPDHETLLTACSLKNPSDTSDHPIVKCCFSFTIRRDEHKLPALIVGNFLPHDPPLN